VEIIASIAQSLRKKSVMEKLMIAYAEGVLAAWENV